MQRSKVIGFILLRDLVYYALKIIDDGWNRTKKHFNNMLVKVVRSRSQTMEFKKKR
jgi:hypothetical protein